VHLAYMWIVSHLSAKNYRNWWKFDDVLTKTNLLSFFWDTHFAGGRPEITRRSCYYFDFHVCARALVLACVCACVFSRSVFCCWILLHEL